MSSSTPAPSPCAASPLSKTVSKSVAMIVWSRLVTTALRFLVSSMPAWLRQIAPTALGTAEMTCAKSAKRASERFTYIKGGRYLLFELLVEGLRKLHFLQDRQGGRFVVHESGHQIDRFSGQYVTFTRRSKAHIGCILSDRIVANSRRFS